MAAELLSIGQMAQINGVSVRALHLYQDKGILEPRAVDGQTGYRRYDIMQSVKLDMVAQLQNAGFSLDEIADINVHADAAYLRARLAERIDEAEAQLRALRMSLQLSHEIAAGCDAYLKQPICNQIMVEWVPTRHILVFDPPSDEDLGGADAPYTENERWEWYQRFVRRAIKGRGWPAVLFRNVGCYVPLEELTPDVDLLHSRPFVFVDESFGPCVAEAVALPASQCLTIYFGACHAEDGSGDDPDTSIGRLLGYAAKKGFKPAGPFTHECIFRYQRYFDERASAFFRYCLPVRTRAVPAP